MCSRATRTTRECCVGRPIVYNHSLCSQTRWVCNRRWSMMHSSVSENFPLSYVCLCCNNSLCSQTRWNLPLSVYLCVLIQDRVQPTLSSTHGEDPGGWRQGHRGMYIHALHSVLPQTHKQPLNPGLLHCTHNYVHNGEQSIPWVHSTFMSCVYTYTCM